MFVYLHGKLNQRTKMMCRFVKQWGGSQILQCHSVACLCPRYCLIKHCQKILDIFSLHFSYPSLPLIFLLHSMNYGSLIRSAFLYILISLSQDTWYLVFSHFHSWFCTIPSWLSYHPSALVLQPHVKVSPLTVSTVPSLRGEGRDGRTRCLCCWPL